jgi:hypothetical protein
MNGGWQTITHPSGQPFANEGLCIAYAIHHPVSLADLANPSVSGTGSGGGSGCSFEEGTFGTTYPGSSAVGTVTLQTDGCIPYGGPSFPLVFLYSGTFTITTDVGTLSGTVTGQINNEYLLIIRGLPLELVTASATLTLTATSGTGLFTGTAGTLNFSAQFPLQFPQPSPLTFVGTITPA